MSAGQLVAEGRTAARVLVDEYTAEIRQNADTIDRFGERQTEVLGVDDRQVLLYSLSLLCLRESVLRPSGEAGEADLVRALGELVAREIEFATGGTLSGEAVAGLLATKLAQTRRGFTLMMQSLTADDDDAMMDLMLVNMQQCFPGVTSIMFEESPAMANAMRNFSMRSVELAALEQMVEVLAAEASSPGPGRTILALLATVAVAGAAVGLIYLVGGG